MFRRETQKQSRLFAAAIIAFGIPSWPCALGKEPQVDGAARIEPLRDIVLHAGGVVEFKPPLNWDLTEVPYGREVRLALRPSPELEREDTTCLIWFAFHVRRFGLPNDEEFERWFATRLRRGTPDHQVMNEPRHLSIGGYDGLRQRYNQATSQTVIVEKAGQQAAVATPWGILEVHGQTVPSQQESLSTVMHELLATVRFHEPREQAKGDVLDSASSARLILGSWKAYRSRMTLRPDGGILIVPDSTPIHLGTRPPHKLTPIVGTFVSSDDVFQVRWNDGSLLNFRWRLDDEQLLLTDHLGRTAILNPLFN